MAWSSESAEDAGGGGGVAHRQPPADEMDRIGKRAERTRVARGRGRAKAPGRTSGCQRNIAHRRRSRSNRIGVEARARERVPCRSWNRTPTGKRKEKATSGGQVAGGTRRVARRRQAMRCGEGSCVLTGRRVRLCAATMAVGERRQVGRRRPSFLCEPAREPHRTTEQQRADDGSVDAGKDDGGGAINRVDWGDFGTRLRAHPARL